MNRHGLLARIKGLGIKTKKGYIVKRIAGKTVQLLKLSDESEEQIIADAVIFTCGNINNHLSIDHKTPLKVYLIGDAKQPRGIMEAIYEGEMVAEDIAAKRIRNFGSEGIIK